MNFTGRITPIASIAITQHGTERQGLMLALAGFALLSVGDSIVKSMAGLWAPTAVAALRYTLAAVGLGALVGWKKGLSALAMPRPELQLLRGVGVGLATVAFFAAIFVMPLADATAMIFTSPMLTSLLAAVFLGEPARRETWAATVVAVAGVLIVLRPNFLALGVTALLPLLSAAGMSLLMIGNRATAGTASPLAQQFYVAVIAAPLLIVAAAIGDHSGMARFAVHALPPVVLLKCALVAMSATTAHWLIYRGTMLAGVATVAPMTYVQLLVATLLGWIVFGNRVEPMSLLGMAVIAAAGLYLWRAGRIREPVVGE